MDLDFRRITLEDKKIINRLVSLDEKHMSWNYSFAMMYVWDAFDKTQICDLGEIALAKKKFFEKTVFFPPYTLKPELIQKALELVEKHCKDVGIPFLVDGICGHDAAFIDKSKYDVFSNRNESDYIYNSRDLIALEGKKYHSKRNFITRFNTKYKYEFVDYTDEDYDATLALYDKWYKKSVHEVLDLERIVIIRALKSHHELGLKIGLIKIDGQVIAFGVCKAENDIMGQVLFEKGDTSFEGVYQIINKLCAERYLSGCKYINRQEDMGIEGLRKSKLSYNPVMIFDKFNVRLKDSGKD